MRVLLNLIWLIFGGLWLALGYAVVALVMFILIITIPFGIASARIALFCLWPFGRTIVKRPDAGTGSLVGNIIWFVLAGWWLALSHIVTGRARCASRSSGSRSGWRTSSSSRSRSRRSGARSSTWARPERLGYAPQVAHARRSVAPHGGSTYTVSRDRRPARAVDFRRGSVVAARVRL